MPGTDHTSEYVPLIVYSPRFKEIKELPLRKTFADIGATIAENFEVVKTRIWRKFFIFIKITV